VTLLWNSIAVVGLAAGLGGPAFAYEAKTVEGGGTIEGVVRFNGAVETRTIIPTKDMAICGAPREEPVIRVGADKAVESAVVYLVGVPAGKAWPAAAPAPTLNQENCRFHPEVQVIPAGPLEVKNSDPVLHNTQGFYGRRSAFNIALPNQGQVIPVELQRPGTVRIDCDAHGWMEGWIYVVDNPYHATTGADGAFSITDVPPGEYTLVAVQPSTAPVETKVTVAGGQATRLEIELTKK
jgi:hypothetical protein